MDTLKNILVLISVIIGFAAISALAEEQVDTVAEEQVDTVIGPKAASTVEQSGETETDTGHLSKRN